MSGEAKTRLSFVEVIPVSVAKKAFANLKRFGVTNEWISNFWFIQVVQKVIALYRSGYLEDKEMLPEKPIFDFNPFHAESPLSLDGAYRALRGLDNIVGHCSEEDLDLVPDVFLALAGEKREGKIDEAFISIVANLLILGPETRITVNYGSSWPCSDDDFFFNSSRFGNAEPKNHFREEYEKILNSGKSGVTEEVGVYIVKLPRLGIDIGPSKQAIDLDKADFSTFIHYLQSRGFRPANMVEMMDMVGKADNADKCQDSPWFFCDMQDCIVGLGTIVPDYATPGDPTPPRTSAYAASQAYPEDGGMLFPCFVSEETFMRESRMNNFRLAIVRENAGIAKE